MSVRERPRRSGRRSLAVRRRRRTQAAGSGRDRSRAALDYREPQRDPTRASTDASPRRRASHRRGQGQGSPGGRASADGRAAWSTPGDVQRASGVQATPLHSESAAAKAVKEDRTCTAKRSTVKILDGRSYNRVRGGAASSGAASVKRRHALVGRASGPTLEDVRKFALKSLYIPQGPCFPFGCTSQ